MTNNLVTCIQLLIILFTVVKRAKMVPLITKAMLNSLNPNDLVGLRSDLLELILNESRALEPKQEITALKKTKNPRK